MEQNKEALVNELVLSARRFTSRRLARYESVGSIRSELRAKRKLIIGSSISLRNLICENGKIQDEAADALAEYLSSRAASVWNSNLEREDEFCQNFSALQFMLLQAAKLEMNPLMILFSLQSA